MVDIKPLVKKLNGILISFYMDYIIFFKTPCCCEYTCCTKSTVFPVKFCSIRWFGNSKPIQIAYEMMSFSNKFLEAVYKTNLVSDNCKIIKIF